MPSYRTVSISDLTPGSVLATPVFDKNFNKLLRAGARINQRFINRLKSRGITEVQVESNVGPIVTTCAEVLPDETAAETVPIQRCSGCRSVIEVRAPNPDMKATVWMCNKCGAIYFGSDEQGAELRGLTRADCNTVNPFAMTAETKDRLPTPTILPENVQRLAKYLTHEEVTWAERRRHKRYPVAVPVVVLPLATDFRVTGDPIPMTTANVSLGGAALLHTRFVNVPHLVIDFSAAGLELLKVVFTVLRCRSVGPVYEIGGEFISRLS